MSNDTNTPAPAVTPDTLNSRMEFYCPIRVLPGGVVIPALELDAPELYMEVDGDGQSIHADDSDIKGQAEAAGWRLLQGYTGQYSYNGPVMHPSEFIGGGMARDILDTPGYYVALVVEAPCNYEGDSECDIETGCECEPAGWAVAFREADDFDALPVRDVWHYGRERMEIVEPFSEVAERFDTEARHGATRDTLDARLQNAAAALEELKDTGRSESWSWHTLTFENGGA